tara:strand:+ start:2262 stop:4454 length:2193 start_codon:yes stop_codon:yes gene_type:complete
MPAGAAPPPKLKREPTVPRRVRRRQQPDQPMPARPHWEDVNVPQHYQKTENANGKPVRKCQVDISNRMVKHLLRDDTPNVVELQGKHAIGKTVPLGVVVNKIARAREKHGNTLTVAWSAVAAFEATKVPELGAFLAHSYSMTNKNDLMLLRQEMETHNHAVLYTSRQSFQAMAGGRNKKDFVRVQDEDPVELRTKPPASESHLAELCRTLNVQTLVIVVDEHQGILTDDQLSYSKLLMNHVAISKATWNQRYDVFIVAASANAVPEEESDTTVANLEIFYRGTTTFDCYGDSNDNDTEHQRKRSALWQELLALQASLTFKFSNEEEKDSLSSYGWMKKDGVSGQVPRQINANALDSPTSISLLDMLGDAIAMEAVMAADDDAVNRCVGKFECGMEANTHFVEYVSSSKKATNECDVLTKSSIEHALAAWRHTLDVQSYLRGNSVSTVELLPRVLCARKQWMRRITELRANPENPVAGEERIEHYPCVLVVVPRAGRSNMKLIQGVCGENKATENARIFDFTKDDGSELQKNMQGEVKDEFLRNERTVYVVVPADRATGSNHFGSIVTTVVVFGKLSAADKAQMFERVARCNAPYVNMVLPLPGEYKFFHVASQLVHKACRRRDKTSTCVRIHKFQKYVATGDSHAKYCNNVLQKLIESYGPDSPEVQFFYCHFIHSATVECEPVQPLSAVSRYSDFLKWADSDNDAEKKRWTDEWKRFLEKIWSLRRKDE